MRLTQKLLPLTLPLLLAQTTAPATKPAEKVDNPMYAVWAKAAPGTTLTCASATSRGNEAGPESLLVFRLLNVTPDTVNLEYGPGDRPDSRRKLAVPAKVEPGEEPLFFLLERRSRMAVKSSTSAPDKITVDGKPIDATCYTVSFDGQRRRPSPLRHHRQILVRPHPPLPLRQTRNVPIRPRPPPTHQLPHHHLLRRPRHHPTLTASHKEPGATGLESDRRTIRPFVSIHTPKPPNASPPSRPVPPVPASPPCTTPNASKPPPLPYLIDNPMLPTEPYLTQKPLWPTERQHILAHHNADSLVVYQAHRPEVARYAVQHHTLGGPYSALPLRDTWVTGRPWTAWERPE